MVRYVIDSNIPFYIRQFNRTDCKSVIELGIAESDLRIWEYAKNNNATILTQDWDFIDLLSQFGSPPKVVHLRVGNTSIKAFKAILDVHWESIEEMLEKHNLVTVFPDVVFGRW